MNDLKTRWRPRLRQTVPLRRFFAHIAAAGMLAQGVSRGADVIEVTATINTSALDALSQRIKDAAAQAVRKAAFKIELDAKMMAPVDTGALRASIFTVTTKTNGKGAAMSSASIANPGVRAARFNEIPDSEFEAYVVVGVEYGIYQEFGWGGRPGRFYLTRAGAQNRGLLSSELAKAMK